MHLVVVFRRLTFLEWMAKSQRFDLVPEVGLSLSVLSRLVVAIFAILAPRRFYAQFLSFLRLERKKAFLHSFLDLETVLGKQQQMKLIAGKDD